MELPHWFDIQQTSRIEVKRRADGVIVALDLEPSGEIAWVALFPSGGAPSRCVRLTDVDNMASAVRQVDERWPPSPWMMERIGTEDYGGIGDVHPLQFRDEKTGAYTIELKMGERRHLIVDPIPYQKNQLIGAEVEVLGAGSVVVESLQIGGDLNLLTTPYAVPCAYKATITALRSCPVIVPGNMIWLWVRAEGADTRVQIRAMVRRLQDEALGPSGQPNTDRHFPYG